MIFKDLYNYIQRKNATIIDNIQKDYLTDYYTNSSIYDINMLSMYKTLILNDTIDECIIDDNITLYNNIIKSVILINDYKYTTLYKTTILEYNPIWNVDGTTVTNYGSYSIGNVIGDNTVTTIYGEHNDSYILGAKTDTSVNTYGERVNVNGARVTTDTKSVSAYDVTTFSDTDKNVTNQTEYTDTSNSYKDNFTNTIGGSTNTTKYGKVENTVNNGARNDNQIFSEHKDIVERQGNIGVTSTQNLIQQEREIALFAFYSIIFNDIINFISIGVFESEVE